MKCVWVSFHQEGYDCLEAMLEDGYRFEAIFSFTDEKAQSLSAHVDFRPLANRYDVPIHLVESLMSDEAIARLEAIQPDIIFVIGWTEIIRKKVLVLAKEGCIGMHASLIPEYRGGSPVNWAIIHGETRTGQTMFWLAGKLDQGDIIGQEPVDITPQDTCGTVYKKVAQAGVTLLRKNLPLLLEGRAPRTAQQDTDRPLWPRRKPSDGLIDFNQPARKVYDFIRAVTHPYPGTYFLHNGKQVFVWEAECITSWRFEDDVPPGKIVEATLGFGTSTPGGVIVACVSGAIILRRIQFAGQPEVDAYSSYLEGLFG